MKRDVIKTESTRDGLPLLLTTREAARLTGVGERTFWTHSRRGIAPAPVFLGDGVRPSPRYRRDELLQWVEDGCPRVGA